MEKEIAIGNSHFWCPCFFVFRGYTIWRPAGSARKYTYSIEVGLVHLFMGRNQPTYMCRGLNSHCFPMVSDGHQAYSRGLYTHSKDSLLGGMSLCPM